MCQAVRLGDVQPAGKRMHPAADWARGAGLAPGERFTADEPAADTAEGAATIAVCASVIRRTTAIASPAAIAVTIPSASSHGAAAASARPLP